MRVRIDERYAGFPTRALGGYVAGLLARELVASAAIEVRLERPVSIGDEVAVLDDALVRDGARVATARPVDLELHPPRAVARAAAEDATAAYLGFAHHLFPTCFCCGPARSVGDGLRIFPGVAGHGVVAAPWRPADAVDAAIVPPEIVWSALDCPGIWSQVFVTSGTGDKAVSGSLAVAQLRPIAPRETHVVMGWPIGREGRKIQVGAAIADEQGTILAVARHTLIVTEAGVPLDIEAWQGDPSS